MAADWQAIEDALQAWAVRASGLPAASVRWADQDATRPQPPFVELRLDHEGGGAPVPEQQTIDNPTPSAGQEILINTITHEDLTLTVHAFTAPTVGANSARALASRMKAQIASETEIGIFDDAGIAIVETGPVQNLTAVLETKSEGRAVFDVRLRVADGFTEATTYVETVDIPTGTITS